MGDWRNLQEMMMREFRTEHAEWREILRDVQTVREGLDGTSGERSPYEALERLKQDVRSEKNSREVAECYAEKYWKIIERLVSECERLEDENERLRKTLE